MKKLFTIAVLMALSMIGMAQENHYDFAETVESGQTLYFLKGNSMSQEVKVTYPYHGAYENYYYGFDRPTGDLVIPSTIMHDDTIYTVTQIDNHAFYLCTNLTSVVFPNTLDLIDNFAFYYCEGINGEIVIPNNVTTIGDAAFCLCENMESIVISEGVSHIGGRAFEECNSLKTLVLPSSLSMIGDHTFYCLGITSITSKSNMPPSAVYDPNDPFYNSFLGINNAIPVYIPFGTTEAYQNAAGWNYFTNFIEEEPIIYTDFEPDTCKFITSSHESDFMFDIDHDGTVDMTLSGYTQHGAVLVNIAMSNGFQLCRSNENTILNADTINWFQADDLSNGLPLDSYRKRYAFRKTVGEHHFYGWMEIYWDGIFVSEGKMIYLDRMAFCTIPDYPLRWGQIILDNIEMEGAEWYYEILNDDGSITYQHLECTGDTVVQGKRPKVIVRSNTHYDRDTSTEVTHEYVYEENGIVYWWNKNLEEFTTLYNFNANTGDEWEIKVETESFTIHVNAVENYEYEGKTYRMLSVNDSENLFSGNIVCGIGHLTSFFPERLMNRGKGYRVEGMRCYWVEGDLVFKYGDRDCDEVYEELHHSVIENGPSTSSGTFTIYPNPANCTLYVQMVHAPSLPDQTYWITNLMGQTLLQGTINNETQQIIIESLPAGIYFIIIAGETRKIMVR